VLAPVLVTFQAVDALAELGEGRLHLGNVGARFGDDPATSDIVRDIDLDRADLLGVRGERGVDQREAL